MRRVVVVLVLVLGATLSFARGATEPAVVSRPGEHSVADIDASRDPLMDPYGKYDPPIRIELVHTGTDSGFWFEGDDTIDNNIYTRTWLERLGIELSFKWTTTASQAEEKMNIMMASGDLPDMIAVGESQFQRLLQANRLHDLTAALVNYATPYTKTYLQGDYALLLEKATRNGSAYGIGNGFSFKDSGSMVWIRADWLSNLGLDAPSTVAELEAIMDAFVHGDPNGSGQDDTYAIALGAAGMGTSSANFGVDKAFFTMFGSYPGAWIKQPDGSLQQGMLGSAYRSATRLALVKLNEYHAKGYLHHDFATFDNARVNEEIANGRAGIVFSNLWAAWWPLNLTRENDESADWVPVPVPSYEGHGGRMSYDIVELLGINVATTRTAHPEALVKMTNLYHALNNDPATAQFEVYNTTPDWNQLFLMYPLQIYNPAWNFEGFEAIASAFRSRDPSGLPEAYAGFYDQLVAYTEHGDLSGWQVYRSYTSEGSLGVVDTYIRDKRIQFNEYTGQPTDTMIYEFPVVKKLYDQMFFEVVMDGNPTAFDEFMMRYDSLYGRAVAEEVNDWFAASTTGSFQDWFEAR